MNEDSEYWNDADEAFFASADLTTPQATPPSSPRWFKQPPSASKKVAYVLFATSGDQEKLGVYYNWYAPLHLTTHQLTSILTGLPANIPLWKGVEKTSARFAVITITN